MDWRLIGSMLHLICKWLDLCHIGSIKSSFYWHWIYTLWIYTTNMDIVLSEGSANKGFYSHSGRLSNVNPLCWDTLCHISSFSSFSEKLSYVMLCMYWKNFVGSPRRLKLGKVAIRTAIDVYSNPFGFRATAKCNICLCRYMGMAKLGSHGRWHSRDCKWRHLALQWQLCRELQLQCAGHNSSIREKYWQW